MKHRQHHSNTAHLRRQAEEAFREKIADSPEMLEPLTPEDTRRILYELRVHQIQLEMQNEELHLAQDELVASQERFFDLYELAPVGYMTVSEAGLIQQINLRAATLLGVARRDPIQRPITHVIFRADQDIFHLASQKLVQTGQLQSCELRMVRNDGTPVWVHLTFTLARDAAGSQELRLALADITERKRAAEELNTERNLLRTLVDILPTAVFVKDRESRFLLANTACANAMEVDSPESLIGKTDAAFFPPKIAAKFRDDDMDVLMGQRMLEREYRRELRNGDLQVMLVSKVPLQSSTGETTGLVGVAFDITQRVQMEGKLRSSAAFQWDILNSLPAHIAVLDRTGTIVAVNERWLRFARENGNPGVEHIGVGTNYPDAFHSLSRDADSDAKADAKAAAVGVESVLSGKQPRFIMEYPCDAPGHARWFMMESIKLAGEGGGAIVAHTDISERKQSQRMLAWEKSALESIVGAASPGQVLDELMLGMEAQMPGALCSMLLLDTDGLHLRHGGAPSLPEAYNRAIDGVAIGTGVGSCGTAAFENRQVVVTDIASDPLWANYRELALGNDLRACWSTPIRSSQGCVLGTFAIYYRESRHPVAAEMEVIERAVQVIRIAIESQSAEQKICKLHAELEQRVEERTIELQAANTSLNDFKAALDEHAVVAITDTDGTITYANDKFCEISKYSRDELLGQNHRMVNSGHHPKEFFRDLWEMVLSGRTWKGEIKNRAKDGSIYWVNTTIVPFFGPDGKPIQFIVIRNDVSERKQIEERVQELNAVLKRRAEALEKTNKEMESFSYSVSHDLRAPLRAVDGFSHMVLEDYAGQLDEEGRRMLGVIHSEAQRMGRLIDDLLAFARLGRQPLEPTRIDMETMARQVFDELAARQPERKLLLNLPTLPPVHGTEALIRQVWINLISNAIKFTSGREVGEIEIGARDGGGDGQIFYVKDNGVGFDTRYADKLFGVFQRLHSQGEFPGTGVGLALVQRIVQRHDGRIWAEAEVDHGATFYFTLPNQPE
jgi:PAS domain S-box-containing protein